MIRAVSGQVSGGDIHFARTPPKMNYNGGAARASGGGVPGKMNAGDQQFHSNCSTAAPTPNTLTAPTPITATNVRRMSAPRGGSTAGQMNNTPRAAAPSPTTAAVPGLQTVPSAAQPLQVPPATATTSGSGAAGRATPRSGTRSATPRSGAGGLMSGAGTPRTMRALMPDELVNHLLTLEKERRLGEQSHKQQIKELKDQEFERAKSLQRAQRDLDREINATTKEVRRQDAHATKISVDLEILERTREAKVPLKHKAEQRFEREIEGLTKKHEKVELNYANQKARCGEMKGRLNYLQYCRKKLQQGVILDLHPGSIPDYDPQSGASNLQLVAQLQLGQQQRDLQKENKELKQKIHELKQQIADLEDELRKYKTHAKANYGKRFSTATSSSLGGGTGGQGGLASGSASQTEAWPRGQGSLFSRATQVDDGPIPSAVSPSDGVQDLTAEPPAAAPLANEDEDGALLPSPAGGSSTTSASGVVDPVSAPDATAAANVEPPAASPPADTDEHPQLQGTTENEQSGGTIISDELMGGLGGRTSSTATAILQKDQLQEPADGGSIKAGEKIETEDLLKLGPAMTEEQMKQDQIRLRASAPADFYRSLTVPPLKIDSTSGATGAASAAPNTGSASASRSQNKAHKKSGKKSKTAAGQSQKSATGGGKSAGTTAGGTASNIARATAPARIGIPQGGAGSSAAPLPGGAQPLNPDAQLLSGRITRRQESPLETIISGDEKSSISPAKRKTQSPAVRLSSSTSKKDQPSSSGGRKSRSSPGTTSAAAQEQDNEFLHQGAAGAAGPSVGGTASGTTASLNQGQGGCTNLKDLYKNPPPVPEFLFSHLARETTQFAGMKGQQQQAVGAGIAVTSLGEQESRETTVPPLVHNEYEDWGKCRPWNAPAPSQRVASPRAPAESKNSTAPRLTPPAPVVPEGIKLQQLPEPARTGPLLTPPPKVIAAQLPSPRLSGGSVPSPRNQRHTFSASAGPPGGRTSLAAPSPNAGGRSRQYSPRPPPADTEVPVSGVWSGSRVVSERVVSRSPRPDQGRVISERIISTEQLPARQVSSQNSRVVSSHRESVQSANNSPRPPPDLRQSCGDAMPAADAAAGRTSARSLGNQLAPPAAAMNLPARSASNATRPSNKVSLASPLPSPRTPLEALLPAAPAMNMNLMHGFAPPARASSTDENYRRLLSYPFDFSGAAAPGKAEDAIKDEEQQADTLPSEDEGKNEKKEAGDSEAGAGGAGETAGAIISSALTAHQLDQNYNTSVEEIAPHEESSYLLRSSNLNTFGVVGPTSARAPTEKFRGLVRSVTAKALREYRVNHRVSLRGSLPQALCRPTLRDPRSRDTSASPDFQSSPDLLSARGLSARGVTEQAVSQLLEAGGRIAEDAEAEDGA